MDVSNLVLVISSQKDGSRSEAKEILDKELKEADFEYLKSLPQADVEKLCFNLLSNLSQTNDDISSASKKILCAMGRRIELNDGKQLANFILHKDVDVRKNTLEILRRTPSSQYTLFVTLQN